ncbi:MAG: hypothetical protein IQL11_04105 [Bacteroidales bacterium]|nr:hypothetical protein [Bacteroidales bacterium]
MRNSEFKAENDSVKQETQNPDEPARPKKSKWFKWFRIIVEYIVDIFT